METRPVLLVLPPALDGAKVHLDDVGGGHDGTATVGEFGEATMRFDVRIGAECPSPHSFNYTFLTVEKDGWRPYRQDGVRVYAGAVQIRIGVPADPSREGSGYHDTHLPAVQPDFATVERALVGPLRVVDHDASKTHSYADDSGPRRVLFCSWFCALREWRDDPVRAAVVLDRIVEAGYQGIRIFRVLGESDTSGYFAGRAVLPEWSIDALLQFANECQRRNLRLVLTCGRQWANAERLAWERRCAESLQTAGLAPVIALWEGDNEYWQNAPGRDSDEQIAFYGQLFAMVRQTLSPAPLCACGAPQDESPDKLYRAASHSDICEKHGERSEDFCVKRSFGVWYWEGDPGHFPKPFWEGEPVPPPSPDAFMPSASPGRIVATLAMNQLVGSAVSYFTGDAVRGRDPSIAKGFREVPRLLAALPEDIATWGHVPGGRVWWWQGPGNRFATVVDEQWGSGALIPPRPVQDYQIIGPGWTVREGTGAPTLNAGDGGALIVGHFV